MPIHDWSQVEAGLFHDFHQAWTIEIRNSLNQGRLPPDFFAMTQQFVTGPFPDVVTPQGRPRADGLPSAEGGVAVAEAPPRARFVTSAAPDRYAAKANRIVIKHRLGIVVAVLPIFLEPGRYVPAPLESSYQTTWEECPSVLKGIVMGHA